MENLIDYFEAYFQLTTSDEKKGVRELNEEFNKQTYKPSNNLSWGFILHVYREGGVGTAVKMHQLLILYFVLGLVG